MLGAALRLLIVLPLVTFMAYFFIKYGLARRSRVVGGPRRMKIIEQLPIGPKAFLTLVEVGGSYFLLAQHEKGVNVLGQMDELPGPVTPGEKEMDFISLLSDRVSKYRSRE
jgi:flagellar protein FliO/FliZ